MNKKSIIYIVLVIVIAGTVGYFYLSNYFDSEEDEINKIYIAADFPSALGKVEQGRMSQEILNLSLEDLNKQYRKLQEGDHIYIRWVNVGILKKRFDDYQGAEKAWLRATDYAPEQTLAMGNLADMYLFDMGQYEKAEEYYQKVLSMNTSNYNYYVGLASLYRFNMTEKAHLIEGIMTEAAEKNPAEAGAYYLYLAGYFAREGNDIDKAKYYSDKTLELNPELEDQLPKL